METANYFSEETDIRSAGAGEVIFREGDESQGLMYAVLEGVIEISTFGRVLEVVRPGGIFGEMALIDRHSRAATATAREPSVVAVINEERFIELVSQNPRLALDMMRILSDRVRRNLRD